MDFYKHRPLPSLGLRNDKHVVRFVDKYVSVGGGGGSTMRIVVVPLGKEIANNFLGFSPLDNVCLSIEF